MFHSNIIEKQADMSICSYYRVSKDNEREIDILQDSYIHGETEIMSFINEFFGKIHISVPWGTLYKREKMGYFREGMSYGEDTLFKIDYFDKINSLVISSQALYYYKCYENSNSLSNKLSDDCFMHYEFLYERLLELLFRKCNFSQVETVKVNYSIIAGVYKIMRFFCEKYNKEVSEKYIKNICSSEVVHLAAKNIIGKYGFKTDLKAIVIYFNLNGCIRILIKFLNKRTKFN